jgi:hypothetical protein
MTRQKKNLKTASYTKKNNDLILKMIKKAKIFCVRVHLTVRHATTPIIKIDAPLQPQIRYYRLASNLSRHKRFWAPNGSALRTGM